jgi:hypothetical protein
MRNVELEATKLKSQVHATFYVEKIFINIVELFAILQLVICIAKLRIF